MIARYARKEDAADLDRLLEQNARGDVRVDRDIIVLAGRPPTGVLVWRPVALVHELVSPGLFTANALVNFAVGQGAGRSAVVRDAVFVVHPGNERMLAYARRMGAVEEEGRLFSLVLD